MMTTPVAEIREHASKWLELAENKRAGWGGLPSIPIGLVRNLLAALAECQEQLDRAIRISNDTEREYEAATHRIHALEQELAKVQDDRFEANKATFVENDKYFFEKDRAERAEFRIKELEQDREQAVKAELTSLRARLAACAALPRFQRIFIGDNIGDGGEWVKLSDLEQALTREVHRG